MVNQSATPARWNIRDIEGLPKNEWMTYEIIDGALFATEPPHLRHQQTVGRICSILSDWSAQSGLGEAIFRPGVVLSETDSIVPDVVWVSQEKLATTEDELGHLIGLPELLVEVLSPDSQDISRDREAKLKLYSVWGALEYWIADRFSKQLEVYRREKVRLVLTETLTAEDTLTSPLLPEFSCPVSQIFA